MDRQDRRGAERATATAIVVVEVLSPSTDLAHHVGKLQRYRTLDSLRCSVVLDQVEPVAHVWARGAEGWPSAPVMVGADGIVDFPEIGAAVPMRSLYRPVGRAASDPAEG